jgi:hypothetical protein
MANIGPRQVAHAGEREAPRLLLDTNIFRALADGSLQFHADRLLDIAKARTPPLLWACEITVEELLNHVRTEEAADFTHFRTALEWMDRLCGNAGMAETLPWILRHGAVAIMSRHDDRFSATFNHLRRQVIKATRFEDLPANLVGNIAARRTTYLEQIEDWARYVEVSLREIQLRVKRSRLDAIALAKKAVLHVSRVRALEEAPVWGPLRSVKDQAFAQRERIAFEAAQIFKVGGRTGYNPANHPTDYSDMWLCAYPAAGYTLVTQDARLMEAMRHGRCQAPRIVDLEEGIAMAEAWLTS